MTKGQAIAQVASHVAGLLQAGSFEEATGVREEDVTEAEARKLGEAVDIVSERLYRMGRT